MPAKSSLAGWLNTISDAKIVRALGILVKFSYRDTFVPETAPNNIATSAWDRPKRRRWVRK
jgi:hypothetical protein